MTRVPSPAYAGLDKTRARMVSVRIIVPSIKEFVSFSENASSLFLFFDHPAPDQDSFGVVRLPSFDIKSMTSGAAS